MTAPYSLVTFASIYNDSNHMGLFVSQDGMHVFHYGQANERLYSYTMSTPWSVATLAFERSSAELYTHSNNGGDLYVKSDGLKLFLLGTTDKRVSEYSMSTAWNISTLSWVKDSALSGGTPTGIAFSTDGTKMYTIDYDRKCYEYTLSTPWDIATKSLTYTLTMDVGAYYPYGLWLSDDGKRLFSIGTYEKDIIRYDLGTAFDLSTGTFVAEFSLYDGDYPPVYPPLNGICYSPDESKMYLAASNDSIGGYKLYESDSVPITPPVWWTNFRGQTEIA